MAGPVQPLPVRDRPLEERSYRGWFVALAVLVAASSAWVVWDETTTRRPWKSYQRDFNQLLADRGQPRQPLRIVQVSNPELGVVDRCQSCHLGVDRPGFDGPEIAPVFRTHPRREVLLGPGHRVAEVGCTICHQGQGMQTKGVRGERFDHGRNDPYWDRPMLAGNFVESTCVTCHDADDPVPDAPTFERGRQLFEDLRCFGCHRSQWVTPDFAIAPPFDPAKTSRDLVTRWLEAPTALRPDTRMPSFWPDPIAGATGAPVDAAARVEWTRARDQEIAAITSFLADLAPGQLPVVASAQTLPADLDAGRQLFDTVGCRGCHAVDVATVEVRVAAEPAQRRTGWLPERARGDASSARREEGVGSFPATDEQPRDATQIPILATEGDRFGALAPNLARIGEMASATWLTAWLAKPVAVWSGATMPDLRLEADELRLLVSYLGSLRSDGAAAVTPLWPDPEPAEVAAGRAAIEKYGCYGCHDIPGFERAGRAGVDLEGYGDKTTASLAWGDAANACEPPSGPSRSSGALACFTQIKIASPRRFSGQGLISVMPSVALAEADARALAVFSLGHRRREVPPRYHRQRTETQRVGERGERLLARKSCRGCHEIGRIEQPIVDDDGEVIDTEYLPIGARVLPYYETPAQAPPPLTFAGEKFEYPWLYDFLGAPFRIRPWLVVRMPTFALSPEQRTLLVHNFAVRDGQPYPFVADPRPTLAEADSATARALFETLQCTKCHQVSTAAELPVGDRAPDLALTAGRLRNSWQRRWILSPQRLQPGTRMPTYFPLADQDDPDSTTSPCPDCFGGDIDRQVDALVSLTNDFAR